MSEKEKYAHRAMGEKCANCGDYITLPESIMSPKEPYKKCGCCNPQTFMQKAFSGVPVVTYDERRKWGR